MAMNNIPVSDKQKVVDRLGEGQSYSQAMISTSIKSKDTVHRIAKNEANAIERKRQQYLKKIKRFGGGDQRRALMWARMLNATKRIGKNDLEQPDWQARAIALKYIDTLAELDRFEPGVHVEVNNMVPREYIRPNDPDYLDWNEQFKKFLMADK